MSESDDQRRARRAHALAAIGLKAIGRDAYSPSDAIIIRAQAAMLADVEETLAAKIARTRPF